MALLGALCSMAWAGLALGQSRDITTERSMTEKRVALVIGNAKYLTSPLRNPVNDARAIAQALRDVQFEVLAHEDLDYKRLRRAIVEFGAHLQTGAVGLFYFAGHGAQVNGRNYIIPIDAKINSENEIEVEAVDVASVLARMDTAKNRLNIVILDACRDNPFGRSFRTLSRGLASIDAPSGTLIAYATAPGRVAADGEGVNGIYTGELLKAVRQPGLALEEVFKRVGASVRRLTKDQQVPWYASSLEGAFSFTVTAPGRWIRPESVQWVGTTGFDEIRIRLKDALSNSTLQFRLVPSKNSPFLGGTIEFYCPSDLPGDFRTS
jgi:uncharacterized caspase-like protein